MNKSRVFFMIASVLALLCLPMEFALAVPTWGEVGENVGETAQGLGQGTKLVGLLIGLGFAIGGVVGLSQAKKSQQPVGPSIAMIVAGVVLASLTVFISSGSKTLFGDDNGSEMSELLK